MKADRSDALANAEYVDRDDHFAEVLAALQAEPRYALDTEFHRERTYYPRLALVQLAWADRIVLVDPLGVDIRALAPLFGGPGVCVLHAAQQDLDVLQHAVGAIPAEIFDTQIAAGFVGYGTPSLTALLQGEVGVTPAKGDRLTDWLRRPLSSSQRLYAASDVAWLLEVHDRLRTELERRGRLEWALEACEELRARPHGVNDPDQAWLRLKDARSLKPRGRAVAQAVARWRDLTAARQDVPVRQVLPDLAVLGIAQRQPATVDELAQSRGVDDRHARGRVGAELLEAVAAGVKARPPEVPDSGLELERTLRPAVTLVSALISQAAKAEKIETSMLATRADIIAVLSGDPAARLHHGWRHELVGGAIERLMSGRAAMTFDREGGLRLVDITPG